MTDKIKYSSISVGVAVISLLVGAAGATTYHGMNLQKLQYLEQRQAEDREYMREELAAIRASIEKLSDQFAAKHNPYRMP